MTSILIVDDEHFVRMGIRSSLDWEKYGYVVAGEAENGIEALEKIRSLNPDIVFLDITMPEKTDWIRFQRRGRRDTAGISPC